LYKTEISAGDQHGLSLPHSVNHFLAISGKNAWFAGKNASVFKKQRFQPKITTFRHFHTGRTTF